MSIHVDWLEGTDRQIIHFRQQGIWTWEEYDSSVDKIVEMMETVPHYVTVLVDLTDAVTNTRGKEAFSHFTAAQQRWLALPNYPRFFLVLNPSYWGHITLFLVERITRSATMNVVVSIEDAIEKGLSRITRYAARNPQINGLQHPT